MLTASALAERFFHVPLVPKRIVMSMYCLQFKKYCFFFSFYENKTQHKTKKYESNGSSNRRGAEILSSPRWVSEPLLRH